MASPYHYSKRKTEDALEALITQNRDELISAMPIFKGFSGNTLTTTRIEILASRAEPEIFGEGPIGGHVTGNFFVDVVVTVSTHIAGMDRDEHGKNCAAVEDILMSNGIIDELTNLPAAPDDYTAFAWRPGVSEDDADDEQMKTSYEGIMYCCPSIPENE